MYKAKPNLLAEKPAPPPPPFFSLWICSMQDEKVLTVCSIGKQTKSIWCNYAAF